MKLKFKQARVKGVGICSACNGWGIMFVDKVPRGCTACYGTGLINKPLKHKQLL